jgi:hypothetical protein
VTLGKNLPCWNINKVKRVIVGGEIKPSLHSACGEYIILPGVRFATGNITGR